MVLCRITSDTSKLYKLLNSGAGQNPENWKAGLFFNIYLFQSKWIAVPFWCKGFNVNTLKENNWLICLRNGVESYGLCWNQVDIKQQLEMWSPCCWVYDSLSFHLHHQAYSTYEPIVLHCSVDGTATMVDFLWWVLTCNTIFKKPQTFTLHVHSYREVLVYYLV